MDKKTIKAKKLRARHLVVIRGLSQKLAAEDVGVSENTITSWAQKHGWQAAIEKQVEKSNKVKIFLNSFSLPNDLGSNEMETKKFLAGYLVIVKGHSQKEVSKILNVSENSLSAWSKKGDWRYKRKEATLKTIRFDSSLVATEATKNQSDLEDFFEFLKATYPKHYTVFRGLWNEYLHKIQEEMDLVIESWKTLGKGEVQTVNKEFTNAISMDSNHQPK